MAAGPYTTSTALLEALAEAGVRYIFANLGSDHPGLIEALAQANAEGRAVRVSRGSSCARTRPSRCRAAHAYASVSRQPQAVFVHVDAGTQNLGGAVSNAMRGRVPVLIFAGAAPFTITGELPAGRNEFIHWIQDVPDQRGILRGYVKYDNEIRTGRNVKQLVHRALQLARSEPGPVYLVGPREVMEEPVEPYTVDPAQYPPVEPAALTADVTAKSRPRWPAPATRSSSRPTWAVTRMRCPRWWSWPSCSPSRSWSRPPSTSTSPASTRCTPATSSPPPRRTSCWPQADVILVLDSYVPWIHATSRPSPDAAIYAVDIDPLKAGMSMWHVPARRIAAADSKVAVEQITRFVRDNVLLDAGEVETRRLVLTAASQARRAALDSLEQPRRPA